MRSFSFNSMFFAILALASLVRVECGRIRGSREERRVANIDGDEEEYFPTTMPSSMPSPAPTRFRSVVEILLTDNFHALWGGSEFVFENTYQSQALRYLEDRDTSSFSEARIVQLYALACIYYGTNNVPNPIPTSMSFAWFNSTYWLQHNNECTWYGVMCNNNGDVVELDLGGNGLSGYFPSEVLLLEPTLKVLDISRNWFYNKGDAQLYWLGNLTNLEVLNVRENHLVYDGVPPYLAKLTNLIELDISSLLFYGDLSNSVFAGMHKLMFLDIGGNLFDSTLPTSLKSLTDLTYIYLDYSDFRGTLYSFFDGTGFDSLKEVWMDYNDFSGSIPTQIGALTTLESLSLSGCDLGGPLPTELGLLTNMKQMWFYSNDLIDFVPSELGLLDVLTRLELQDNDLSGVMPSEVCARVTTQILDDLSADCDGNSPDLVCPCCTCCGPACTGTS